MSKILLSYAKKAIELRNNWHDGTTKKLNARKIELEIQAIEDRMQFKDKNTDQYNNLGEQISDESVKLSEKYASDIINYFEQAPNINYVKINNIIILNKKEQ